MGCWWGFEVEKKRDYTAVSFAAGSTGWPHTRPCCCRLSGEAVFPGVGVFCYCSYAGRCGGRPRLLACYGTSCHVVFLRRGIPLFSGSQVRSSAFKISQRRCSELSRQFGWPYVVLIVNCCCVSPHYTHSNTTVVLRSPPVWTRASLPGNVLCVFCSLSQLRLALAFVVILEYLPGVQLRRCTNVSPSFLVFFFFYQQVKFAPLHAETL